MTADAQFWKRGGANPRLNKWPEVLDERGVTQHQFRVQVASDPQRLQLGAADLWDSGLHLRAGRSGHYREGRSPLPRRRGIRILTQTVAGIVIEVGSGEYNF